MSSFAGNCLSCGKPVMHKTFFGTLHLCVSDDQESARQAMQRQRRADSSPNQLLKAIQGAGKAVGSSCNLECCLYTDQETIEWLHATHSVRTID